MGVDKKSCLFLSVFVGSLVFLAPGALAINPCLISTAGFHSVPAGTYDCAGASAGHPGAEITIANGAVVTITNVVAFTAAKVNNTPITVACGATGVAAPTLSITATGDVTITTIAFQGGSGGSCTASRTNGGSGGGGGAITINTPGSIKIDSIVANGGGGGVGCCGGQLIIGQSGGQFSGTGAPGGSVSLIGANVHDAGGGDLRFTANGGGGGAGWSGCFCGAGTCGVNTWLLDGGAGASGGSLSVNSPGIVDVNVLSTSGGQGGVGSAPSPHGNGGSLTIVGNPTATLSANLGTYAGKVSGTAFLRVSSLNLGTFQTSGGQFDLISVNDFVDTGAISVSGSSGHPTSCYNWGSGGTRSVNGLPAGAVKITAPNIKLGTISGVGGSGVLGGDCHNGGGDGGAASVVTLTATQNISAVDIIINGGGGSGAGSCGGENPGGPGPGGKFTPFSVFLDITNTLNIRGYSVFPGVLDLRNVIDAQIKTFLSDPTSLVYLKTNLCINQPVCTAAVGGAVTSSYGNIRTIISTVVTVPPPVPENTTLDFYGKATDKLGNPVMAGSANFTVIKESTGLPVWGPYKFDNLIAGGSFNKLLGDGSAGNPMMQLFLGDQYRLRVVVSNQPTFSCPTCEQFELDFVA